MKNNVDVEDIQTIDEICIVKTVNETLMSNNEEISESKHMSGRLRLIPLISNHIHKYEREQQCLSSNEGVNDREKNSADDQKYKKEKIENEGYV